ncbi:disulfide bond formation protein B [Mameliella sediminis]|uniref:disulfide bond formation protein B n=1 Tax=Mameliella sediminis TaxID=2836866 RepID=UPI001C48A7D5|nr:disulfide bond formation protein B [Mameliella sediminis]MBY6114587.1 disulfide bond formation protein B [Antarctobacter heliothermus]MBY6144160.1 disulfide bond formation protein B [Mameliella alba]MBV7392932.1 disulfide bond formation protein B [Mameliella sediminis]MBY6161548.1 disulfide bond formation protein B [Mameliella alba]MBY6169986.1 disulfide bond formation protein B [Mameliella alba]
MNRRLLTLLGILGSAGLLLGALYFQYVRGLLPCQLCYWQRYGHVGAMIFGVVALFVPNRILLGLGALAALSSSVIGIFHSGVERQWWDGLKSCSAPALEGLSPEEAMEAIMNAPMVPCDQIPWQMFGLSMANYNVFASAAIAGLFVLAIRAR